MKRIKRLFTFLKRRRVTVITIAGLFLFVAAVIFFKAYRNRDVLAVVNGNPIRVEDILIEAETSPAFYKDSLRMNPNAILDDYINQVLLFRESKKYERELKRDIEGKMQNYYMKMLTKEYVDRKIAERIKITDEEVAEYYNQHLEDFVIPERVRLFEIVLSSQEAAENVRRRLSYGESFEEIASRDSITESRERNGDLGWIDIRKLEPEIAVLVTRISPGDILANIVRTEVGYHIIKLASRTQRRMLSLQEATPEIKNMLVSRGKKAEVDALVSKLREKGRIKIFPERVERLKVK